MEVESRKKKEKIRVKASVMWAEWKDGKRDGFGV